MNLSGVLGTALSPWFWPVYLLAPPTLYYHFRGKVRLRPIRQLLDHSTFMAPYNVLVLLFSAVKAKPFADTATIPDLKILRDNWEVLREEALALHDEGKIVGRTTYDDAGFNSFFRRGWKRFYLKWYGDPHPSAVESCPRTLEILKQTPSIQAAAFVRMGPKARLPHHRDPFAGSLRYHLGLRTPNSRECRLIVDGNEYFWRDGEDVLFDETYVHQVFNDTDQERIIFFCDVERPLRSKLLTHVNRFVCRRVMRMARSKNRDDEEVGFVNKVFGLVYPIRVTAKKVKAYNEKLYYGLKYTLYVGVAALVVFLAI